MTLKEMNMSDLDNGKQKYWSRWKPHFKGGNAQWEYLGADSLAEIAAMSEAFVYDKQSNPNSGDRVYRSQIPTPTPPPTDPLDRGIHYYASLQTPEGHWAGDYGGPMFLMPGLIIASFVTDTPFAPAQQALMRRYMLNHQHTDGGWGLHLEGQSTMFGTVLQYVSLRILGEDAQLPAMMRARQWIQQHGGATGIPSWGKFYLALLGVYDWQGCNSLLPELWLLPHWLPMHPSRYWCHSRMVYLPMAYCYGHRVTMREHPLQDALKQELYTSPYQQIDWQAARNACCPTDLYYPQSRLLKLFNKLINLYEQSPVSSWRNRALDFTRDYVHAEDKQTNYVDIGPVNQVINSIVVWHDKGKGSAEFKRHVERWPHYLWLAEDGLKMQGYNGSQLWDTAFALQAVTAGGKQELFPEMVAEAYRYISNAQIIDEVDDRERFYRHIQVGGWPFSTRDHGWPISDCTAEGLKAALIIKRLVAEGKYKLPDTTALISDTRLADAVNVLLSYQNTDGGWATYENTRGPAWLEGLNPSEVFGGIMIDYSYTECSSACIQALLAYHADMPQHRATEIRVSILRGIDYILAQQRADGSWYGSWAVCFTYGTWFGVEALRGFIDAGFGSVALVASAQQALDRAVAFLLSKQNTDGGWGESFESCVQHAYVPAATSQVVNTAWASLSLMAALGKTTPDIDRGIQLLLARQQPNGDWLQENISGVFNHNCMITYTAYRNVFPIWALGRWGWVGEKNSTNDLCLCRNFSSTQAT
jgi:squalene/oxidosqualene cyclase-like protein